jgi:hypothetical protein
MRLERALFTPHSTGKITKIQIRPRPAGGRNDKKEVVAGAHDFGQNANREEDLDCQIGSSAARLGARDECPGSPAPR